MNFSNFIPKNPSEVIFWTGAGISLDPPSNLPSGDSLTKDVVNSFCITSTWNNLYNYLKRTRLEQISGNIKSIPRLETILGNIVSILGFNVLDCMSILDGPPNHFHHFFARHISLGGKHITSNLDLCIENAMNQFYPNINFEIITPSSFHPNIPIDKNNGRILHLHGKIGKDLLSLGLTIENVSK